MSDFLPVPRYRPWRTWTVTLACGHGGTICDPDRQDLTLAEVPGNGYWFDCQFCKAGVARASSILVLQRNWVRTTW
jgi:hypothetical protein